MRSSRAFLFIFLLRLGFAIPAPANTLDPSHPVWDDPMVDHTALAKALIELRARQEKEPKGLRSGGEGFARKSSLGRVRRFLVIPVLYSDGPQKGPVAIEELQSRFFDPAREHSFAWYWEEVSGGVLRPRGRVLPWLRLPGPRSLYQNVVGGRPRLAGTRKMAEDAVCAAASSLGPWWDYDDDGEDGLPGSGDDDGFIDFLIVLHPDPGIEIEVESDGVMALQDRLDPASVWDRCQVGADPFVVASAVDPVGVWVHESGHLMGLVDLYDLQLSADETEDGRASGGLGQWSLMATGTWGDEGRQPTGLDAYSRSLLGWGSEKAVADEADIELSSSSYGGEWVRLTPAMDWKRERFLLEARSPTRGCPVDAALPGEGVLIYRVDEAGRACTGADSLVVSLMQADGRRDLEKHANQGDAGDPYTGAPGADELGPSTNPSSFSRRPTPSTLPPRIELRDDGNGSYRVHLEATARARMLMQEARFDGGEVFLRPGSSQSWRPLFRRVGAAVSSARMRVEAVSGQVEVEPGPATWIPLEKVEDGYRPSSEIVFSAPAEVTQLDLPLNLVFDLDGASSSMRLGIPLGEAPGIGASDFARWSSTVLDAGQPSTTLEWTSSAPIGPYWRVDGSSPFAYGNCCELELRSPWIATGGGDVARVFLLSRAHTEGGNPGEAFDGGVVEWRQPGRGWNPLPVAGEGSVRIVPLSRAATAGAMGIGGDATVWQWYSAALPALPFPCQLRLHFAADADGLVSDEEGGWSVARLAVGDERSEAMLTIEPLNGGEWRANLRVTPPPRDLRVSLWGRKAPLNEWFVLAGAKALDAEGTARFTFAMPGQPYLQVGAFEGDEARILLATAGYRASVPVLKVYPNPARSVVQLETGATPSGRQIGIFDLRGRRVRTLLLGANLGLVSWDGKDETGRRVASGRYLARLQGRGESPVIFTLLR